MLEGLKEDVCEANLELVRRGLVLLTWGNASAVDRDRGLVVIKPSGVSYDAMKPDDMVVVDMEGNRVEGRFNPSVDTPSHLCLYEGFDSIGGVVHTHSRYATVWAQACLPIPCFGTTHADHFHGDVPVSRQLSEQEVAADYERAIGESLLACFGERAALSCPAALSANHGPFAWGRSVAEAVVNAVVLEEVARMAWHTACIAPDRPAIPGFLLDKHFHRKHGGDAYYGQKEARRPR